MHGIDSRLAQHGALVLLVGLIGGFPMGIAIKRGTNEVPWRVVHAGGCSSGALLLALSPVSPAFRAVGWIVTAWVWLMIGSIETLVAGMVIAAWSGQRGVAGGGRFVNRLAHRCYVIGSVAALAAGILLVVGCFAFL